MYREGPRRQLLGSFARLNRGILQSSNNPNRYGAFFRVRRLGSPNSHRVFAGCCPRGKSEAHALHDPIPELNCVSKVPEHRLKGVHSRVYRIVNLNTLKKIRECELITPALFDEVHRERVAISLETAALLAETSRLRRKLARIVRRSQSSSIGVVQTDSAPSQESGDRDIWCAPRRC